MEDGYRKNFRDYTSIYQDSEAKRYYTFSHISHYKEQDYPVARVLDNFLDKAISAQESREDRLMANIGYTDINKFQQDFFQNAYNIDILSDLVIENIFNELKDPTKYKWESRKPLQVDDFNKIFAKIDATFRDFVTNYEKDLQIVGKNRGMISEEILNTLDSVKLKYGQQDSSNKINKTGLQKIVKQLMSQTKGGSIRGDVGEIGLQQVLIQMSQQLQKDKKIKVTVERGTHSMNPKADVKLGEIGFQSKNYSIRGDYFDFTVHSDSSIDAMSEALNIYSNGNFDIDAFIFNFVNIYNLTNSGQLDGRKVPNYESFDEWDNILACLRSAATIWLGSTLGFDGGKVSPFKDAEKNEFTDVDFFVVGQKYIQPMSSLLKYIRDNVGSMYPKISKANTYDPAVLYGQKKDSVPAHVIGQSLVYPEGLRKVGSEAGKRAAKAKISMMFNIAVSKFTTKQ